MKKLKCDVYLVVCLIMSLSVHHQACHGCAAGAICDCSTLKGVKVSVSFEIGVHAMSPGFSMPPVFLHISQSNISLGGTMCHVSDFSSVSAHYSIIARYASKSD